MSKSRTCVGIAVAREQRKADIGLLQRPDIVSAVTAHQNIKPLELLHAANNLKHALHGDEL